MAITFLTNEDKNILDGQINKNAEDIGRLSEEIAALKGEGGSSEETVTEIVSGDFVSINPGKGTALSIVTKITGQDAKWVKANRIQLRQVNSKNLFDFTGALGGAGTVVEQNGLTATINDDGTVHVVGTNSGSTVNIVNKTYSSSSNDMLPIFPAGTYTIPSDMQVGLRACDTALTNLENKRGTFTVDVPFYIRQFFIPAFSGASVDKTYPLYIVRGSAPLGGNYAFVGKATEVAFSNKISDGVYDWQTGELKDASGNLLEKTEVASPITAYDGTNTIFTGIGTNDVSFEVGTAAKKEESLVFDYRNCGIPVLELNGDVSAMTKDNAVPMTFVWGDRSGNLTAKKQGSSSIQTGIEIGAPFDTEIGGLFNLTLKFENAFEAKEGWGVQTKYVFKANAIDHSHARNVCSCKLWGEIVKSRENAPTELSGLINGGAIDGFPIIVTLNGKYYAVGTFNIPKDGWMFGAPKAILCADGNTDACKFKGLATLDGDFDLEYVEDEENADWVLQSLNTALQAVIDCDGSSFDAVSQYIDIPSAIDYYIHAVYEKATDGMYRNYLLVTFDGVKWYFSDYDRDTVYGLQWHGKSFESPYYGVSYESFAGHHRLMYLIYNYLKADLKERAVYLRNNALSEANVTYVFTNYTAGIPAELLAHNCRRWPLLRSTSASNVAQILNWYRLRRMYVDGLTDKLN